MTPVGGGARPRAASSVLAPPADVVAALAAHGIDDARVSPMMGGVENITLRVDARGGTFVMTVFRRRTSAAAAAYVRFLDDLSAAGIGAPRPVHRIDGGAVSVVGGAPAILCGLVSGCVPQRLTVAQVSEVGRQAAALHRSGVSSPSAEVLRFASGARERIDALGGSALGRWMRASLDAPAAPGGGIPVATHGDLFPSNIVVRSDGDLMLIDWDDSAQDAPVVDMVMALLGVCSPDERLSTHHVAEFLQGYSAAGGTVPGIDVLRTALCHHAGRVAYARLVESAWDEAAAERIHRLHLQVDLYLAGLTPW